MCSICGGNYPLELIRKASQTMVHRGPDFSGEFSDGVVALAHNRLSIIDLDSEANQPFTSPFCPHLVLVFNGEIYNYKELAKEYQLPVQTKSDTEVLLLLFDKIGVKCFEVINGMFALGIYDAKSKSIILARDRYGKKPLYYSVKNGMFAFASEIKALKTIFNPSLNQEGLIEFLFNLAPINNNTFFEEISKVLPGSYLSYDIECKSIRTDFYYSIMRSDLVSKYWFMGEKVKDINIAKDLVYSYLESSIQLRLAGDVPIACFLSGGLDSSLIAALYSKISCEKINTFSIGYDEYRGQYCELEYANKMASFIDSNHYEIIMGRKEFLEYFDELMEQFDEPINDPAIIPTYILSKKVHQENFKVVLSGEGSDELFFGYDAVLRYIDEYKKIDGISINVMDYFLSDTFDARRIRRLVLKEYPAYRCINESWSQKELHNVFEKNIKNNNYFSEEWKKFAYKEQDDRWCCYIDFKHWIAEVLMTKIDRMSMLNSLEVRTPFLDYRLVDFVMGLNKKFKINNGISKFLLKEIVKDRGILPEFIIGRNKKGFSTPYFEWYFKEYQDRILKDYLEVNEVLGIFRGEYLRFLFKKGQVGEMKSQNWSIVLLSKWLKYNNFI